jgi:glycosyltransferase involved in cell wall biosynthesis
MKNILIVTSALEIGGAERVIANLVRNIDPERFSVTICHLNERGVIGDELLRSGFRVLGIRRHEDPVRRYFTFLGLREVVRDNNIHLLHSHTTYSLADSCMCSMTMRGIRTVHTFHRGNYPNHNRRYMLMERVFSRACDRLIAVGIEQEKKIRSVFRLKPGSIRTILNGVEDIDLTGDAEWAARLRADGRLVIGSISTLIEQKGITFLLDTAAELKRRGENPLFIVVGEGELRPQLEEKCRRLGLAESVIFTGWVSQAAARMLPLFDVFFQPSQWEAMSMVVLEAMAATKPVVVTDVGDNRHVVEHGKNGFVVPSMNVGEMANALQALMSSAERRQQFGRIGRTRFEEHYTARLMARKYEDVYSELLGS